MGDAGNSDEQDEITSMPLYPKVDSFLSSADWDPLMSAIVSNNGFSNCHYPGMSSFADMSSTHLLPYDDHSDKKDACDRRLVETEEAHDDDHQAAEDGMLGVPSVRKRRIESGLVLSPQWNKKAVEEIQKDVKKKNESDAIIIDESGGNITTKNSEDNLRSPENYIHIRARKGQATNSHSIAERVRREKISERMRLLQELVPGCNKITGKAVMLDEIINYVQSLQQQVEFLSMKLATVNPEISIDIDHGPLARDLVDSRNRNTTMLGLSTGSGPSPSYGYIHRTLPNIPTANPQTILDAAMENLYQMEFLSSSSAMQILSPNARPKPDR